MLCHQLSTEDVDASQVAAGPGKAGDKTKPDRIFGDGEDDGDRRRRLLRRRSGIGDGYNHADRPADQFRRQLRQPINRFFRPAVDDRCVLTLDIADRFQTIAECAQAIRNRVGRSDPQKPDDGHRRLLPARREWPRGCRATEQRDERAPLHVWMAPAWQEVIWRAAQRSLAVMCPACWCSPGGLLALMGCANRVLIIQTGSMSR